MAPTFVKAANSTFPPVIDTFGLTVTFGSATTTGNLIVLCMGGDKNNGALTSIPSGFTTLHSLPATSVSLYYVWGVSAGETAYTIGWTNQSFSGNYLWAGEYSEAGSGAWEAIGSASTINAGDATSQSQSSGTTAAVSRDGIAVAAFAVDSGGNIGSTNTISWTNSFTTRDANSGWFGSGSGAGGCFVGEKTITSGNTAGTTFSYTAGTVDQWSGAVGVFSRAPGGGGSTVPTFLSPVQHSPQIISIR